jgi:dTDP-4-amino-4,6-dideoxygalactose transaminase
VKRFEMEFAAFLGVRHAIAVASGTGALHTAFAALGVGPGQEVILPHRGPRRVAGGNQPSSRVDGADRIRPAL